MFGTDIFDTGGRMAGLNFEEYFYRLLQNKRIGCKKNVVLSYIKGQSQAVEN